MTYCAFSESIPKIFQKHSVTKISATIPWLGKRHHPKPALQLGLSCTVRAESWPGICDAWTCDNPCATRLAEQLTAGQPTNQHLLIPALWRALPAFRFRLSKTAWPPFRSTGLTGSSSRPCPRRDAPISHRRLGFAELLNPTTCRAVSQEREAWRSWRPALNISPWARKATDQAMPIGSRSNKAQGILTPTTGHLPTAGKCTYTKKHF